MLLKCVAAVSCSLNVYRLGGVKMVCGTMRKLGRAWVDAWVVHGVVHGYSDGGDVVGVGRSDYMILLLRQQRILKSEV